MPSVVFPCAPKLVPVFTAKQPLIVLYGGRNSTKSTFTSDFLTAQMHSTKTDVLCLREFVDSIDDSIHKIMRESVEERHKLEGWRITDKYCQSPTGSRTSYKGANRHPKAMKSAENFARAWFEEAQDSTADSLDTLIPTIIRRKGAQCIFTFNPRSEFDPISQEFIVPHKLELDKHGFYMDDMLLIIKINWRDNPFFDENANKIRIRNKEKMSAARYLWVWEGEFYDEVEKSIITLEEFLSCVDAHEKLGWKEKGVVVTAHDPADSGDERAVAVRRGNVIIEVDAQNDLNINDSADWACNIGKDFKTDYFVYDADGVGLGLRRQVDDFFEGMKVDVIEFKGGTSPEDPDEEYIPNSVDFEAHSYDKRTLTNRESITNLRAHCYLRLATAIKKTHEAITTGKYYDPDELISFSSKCKMLTKIRSELCKIPQQANRMGKFQIMPKNEMEKKLKVKSPNCADAVMMTMINITSNDFWGEATMAKRPKINIA